MENFSQFSSSDILREAFKCSAVSQFYSIRYIFAVLTLHVHIFIILPIVSTCLHVKTCAVFETLVTVFIKTTQWSLRFQGPDFILPAARWEDEDFLLKLPPL